MDTEACQQVVGGQVLEGSESSADRAHVRVRTIERGDRLAQSEVAPRPGLRAREMPGQEPVRRPLPEAALGDEPRLHLIVRKEAERIEIELAARGADDVLGLAAREADRNELRFAGEREPLTGRERIRVLTAAAEGGDEPVADRKRSEQRHLLRTDRRDERLERIGRKRRAEPRECRNEPREYGLGGRERAEGLEIELEPKQLSDHRFGPRVERLGPDAAVRGLHADLASVDDTVQT